jgi:hypothetical protein
VTTSANPTCDDDCLWAEAAGLPTTKATAVADANGWFDLYAQAEETGTSMTAEARATQTFTFTVPRDHRSIEFTVHKDIERRVQHDPAGGGGGECFDYYVGLSHAWVAVQPGCLMPAGQYASTSSGTVNQTSTWQLEPAGGALVGPKTYTLTYEWRASARDSVVVATWGYPEDPWPCWSWEGCSPNLKVYVSQPTLETVEAQEGPHWASLSGTVQAAATYYW